MLVSKDVTSTKVSVKIDGDIIKQTDDYTYLGQTITSNGKCDDETLKRIEIVRGAFNSMLKTITARHISMKTRKRIIETLAGLPGFDRGHCSIIIYISAFYF